LQVVGVVDGGVRGVVRWDPQRTDDEVLPLHWVGGYFGVASVRQRCVRIVADDGLGDAGSRSVFAKGSSAVSAVQLRNVSVWLSTQGRQ
jgi:hypothetical protein